MIPDLYMENGILISYSGREESVTVPEGIHTIGEGAFKACVSLKKIILPQSLHTIMAGAFKGCRKLEELLIPQSVCRIGEYAFHRCHSLKQMDLPPSVEELGDCTFLYCDSLTRISMAGVRHIGRQAFVNDVALRELVISRELPEDGICDVFTSCGNISSIAFPDGETFTFPNTVEVVAGQMDVPSIVRAIAVDVLRMMELDGRRLVKFLTNLKHVKIPQGIVSIGKSCFFDKRGIVSVTLPASLKEIESRAFRNCISLETVTFNCDAVFIHENAFQNCTSLGHIYTEDGALHSFHGIGELSDEKVPPLVQTIYRQIMDNFLISGTILLRYLGSESRVAVPEGITIIAEEAFAGNEAVDRVILPDSLLEIGASAFRGCLLLQTIEFPGQVRRIGAGAFENCIKLIRAALPPNLKELEDCTFKHCHVLREISFGPKLAAIGEQAFYQCISLKDAAFPQSLVSIGPMAFYRCLGLKEVVLPASVTQAGNLCFGESGVKKVRIFGDGLEFGTDIFSRCPKLHTLILEPGVLHMADRLAFGCISLKRVVVPDSLKSVGKQVVENTPFVRQCGGLSEAEGILWDGSSLSGDTVLPEAVTIVAGAACYGNTSLTRIQIPERVTWIGPAAFKGCERLTALSWPSGIDNMEEEMFAGCCALKSIDTRSSFRSIGQRAFWGCGKLSRLPLDSLEELGKEAFSGCVSLKPEALPALTRTGEGAFDHTCFPPVIGRILIRGQDLKGEVCVPEGICSIAPYACSSNRQITKLILPESLSHVGEGAFWGCSALETVDFSHPGHVCRIDSRAFEKCSSLKSITLSADYAGDRAFAFCTSLAEAALYGVKVLNDRLFEGCRNLKACICPQAEQIGRFCFDGCVNMESFDCSHIFRIRSYGFQNCHGLTKLTLKDGALLMPHAFGDCGRIEEITISGAGDLCLKEYALSGCTSLERIIHRGEVWRLKTYQDVLSPRFPENVRLLYHSALSCFLVEKGEVLSGYKGQGRRVRIPEGIRRINGEVFRDILMLEEVQLPKTVEYIGPRAFHGTKWLEHQRELSPLVIAGHMILDGSCCRGEVVIPEDISLVCGWAFANGMGIRSIRVLSHRVKVEEYAFRNCIYLEQMTLADRSVIEFHGIQDRRRSLPAIARQAVMDRLNCFKTDENDVLAECTGNISDLLVADGITAIGAGVFQDSNLLSRIHLPDSVTSIGKSAFSGCKWLTVVEHGMGVEKIEAMAFSGCGRLERIELSQALHFIGARAFEHCTSLKEILIPEGIEEIPDRAFFRCHSLERVCLPSSLRRIGREAFAFCKNMQIPSIGSDVAVGDRAFEGCGKEA